MTHRIAAGTRRARQMVSHAHTPMEVRADIRQWNLAVAIKKSLKSIAEVPVRRREFELLFKPGSAAYETWLHEHGLTARVAGDFLLFKRG